MGVFKTITATTFPLKVGAEPYGPNWMADDGETCERKYTEALAAAERIRAMDAQEAGTRLDDVANLALRHRMNPQEVVEKLHEVEARIEMESLESCGTAV